MTQHTFTTKGSPVQILSIPVISTVHQIAHDCWEKQETFSTINTTTGTLVLLSFIDPEDKVPGWLCTIYAWAKANDYEWVWFDADADKIKELPTYEW